MRKLSQRPIPIGRDIRDKEPINLSLKRLSEHADIVGPTGVGKTQSIMLPIFQNLATMPGVSVIAATCKGSFATMCADWAIAHGLTKDLVVFNPGQQPLVGFNPLRRNCWPAERHAKMARTAMLAARGQRSLDDTPQLARLLFLCLAVALEQDLPFDKTARLLRAGRSPLRGTMIRSVRSEFLRESLEWFDGLKEQRQEELAASTVARLENFIGDPLIRAILTEQQRCLDFGDILRNGRKLCIDVGLYGPLVPDDAKTLLRLLINNLLGHQFSMPKEERKPTVLLCDECQEYATEDLATALTLGRELKLYVVMAHQFPSQLKLSAADSHLFEAVQQCCRTKIIFGGMHVDQLEGIVKDAMIDQFNPYSVKDERKTLELEPVETTRTSRTRGIGGGDSRGNNESTSTAVARGRSAGTSRQRGKSQTHTEAFSSMHSSAANSGIGIGATILPNGDMIETESNLQGNMEADASGMTATDSLGEFEAHGTQHTVSRNTTKATARGKSVTVNRTWSESWSQTPFYEYVKRWVVSSRTYQTLEEFLTVALQVIKALPQSHFVVKVPGYMAVFVRANFIREPWIPEALRKRALERCADALMSAAPAAVPAPTSYQLPPAAVKSEGTASPPKLPGEWE